MDHRTQDEQLEQRSRLEDRKRKRNKKKRRRRRMLQRLIPVIVAIVLMVAVLVVCIMTGVFEKYSYSTERADLFEYFSIYNQEDVAVITNNELTDLKAKLYDGTIYLDYDTIQQTMFDRFYYDVNDSALLYTTATDVISIPIGSTSYYVSGTPQDVGYVIVRNEGDQLYIALDYMKNYAAFSYELYEGEPYRMDLSYEWGTNRLADVAKDNHIRTLGGIKSAILKDVKKGDTVIVINEMEEWSEVRTTDGIIGYIENKRLENYREETLTPVAAIPEEVYPNISKDYPINLVWHQVTNETANEKLSEMMEGVSGVNTISPTWFALSDNEGNFTSLASTAYVEQAHAMGLEVWALVDDFTNSVDTYEIFSHSAKRAHLIEQLMSTVATYSLDGLNIDFEQISAETGPHYIQFLRELSIQCRKNGIVLSVDNYVPREFTAHYNREEQGRVVDYVVVMGYDEHWGGSEESGSVASLGFVKEGIEQTLQVVPADKIINALPYYTRIWVETPKTEEEIALEDPAAETYVPYHLSSEAMSMQGAANAVERAGVTATWDDVTAQNYAEYERDGSTYKVWLEDDASITAKMQAIQSYNIAGIAGWKLGLQNNSVWPIISEYLN